VRGPGQGRRLGALGGQGRLARAVPGRQRSQLRLASLAGMRLVRRAPRRHAQAGEAADDAGSQASATPGADAGEAAPAAPAPAAAAPRRALEDEPLLAARIVVEDCLCLLLDVDDIDRLAPGRANEPALRTRRGLLMEARAGRHLNQTLSDDRAVHMVCTEAEQWRDSPPASSARTWVGAQGVYLKGRAERSAKHGAC